METVAQAGQASEKHVVDSERDESRQESVATVHHLRKRHCLFLHSEAELWSSWWGRTGSSAEVEGESRTVSLVRLARLAVPDGPLGGEGVAGSSLPQCGIGAAEYLDFASNNHALARIAALKEGLAGSSLRQSDNVSALHNEIVSSDTSWGGDCPTLLSSLSGGGRHEEAPHNIVAGQSLRSRVAGGSFLQSDVCSAIHEETMRLDIGVDGGQSTLLSSLSGSDR